MSIAVVVVSYKLNQNLIETFCIANGLKEKNIQLYIVCCEDDLIKAPGAIFYRVPEMKIFNIGKCSNVGIKRAIIDGHDIVIKTDIDCCISEGVIKQIEEIELGVGFIYRYWEIDSLRDIPRARINPRCMGTICLHSNDWKNLRGFDERLEGYGYDDYHMCQRARLSGVKIKVLSDPKVYHITHEDKHNRETINPVLRNNNMQVNKKGDWNECKESNTWNF